MDRALIEEQIAYYSARAEQYDAWFFRRGSYDHEEEFRARWSSELTRVESALRALQPYGDVLELACGTGLWTQRLVETASSVTAVDASAEVLAISRARLDADAVQFVQADLFEWKPSKRYDLIFFASWLSHVPPSLFDAFWSLVESSLKPEGRVFLLDNKLESKPLQHQHFIPGAESYVVERVLEDQRRFRIVKVFYEPAELESKLHALGWNARVHATGEFFIYGQASRPR
ncbi:MAG TPA: methyltransferase domain-containing protein [Polyangiales bacterium]|nr:methyltransferase domain-containing protein [Polyangiales bacterium]